MSAGEPSPSRRVRRGLDADRADAESWRSLTPEQRVELLWGTALDELGRVAREPRGVDDRPRLPRSVRRVRRAARPRAETESPHVAPTAGIDADDFTDPEIVFQIGLPPNRVDVLTAITGVEFEDAWASRVTSRYGDVDVAYIGLGSLLRAKRAAGRPQDLVDADELERRRAPPAG